MDTLISLINTLYPLELRFSRNKKQIVTPTKTILSKKDFMILKAGAFELLQINDK